MRVLSRTLAAAGAVGVITLAGPAFAAGPYNVSVGSKTSGQVPFTSTAGAIKFTTSGGLNLGCQSGTANGKINAGPSSTGVGIGLITASTFTGCKGPLNLSLNVTQTKVWKLNAKSPAGVNTGGVIAGVGATVKDANGQCAFNVTGAVQGNFNSTAQTITVVPTGPKLKIANVQGCFGQVANGQTAQFGATYKVKNSVGKITVK